MSRVLYDNTAEGLELLPPFLRNDPSIQGTLDVLFRELARIQIAADELTLNYFPETADRFIGFWEALFGLSSTGKTIEQRRQSVLHFLDGMSSTGYGSSWSQLLASMAGSEGVYAESNAAGIRGVLWERYLSQPIGATWTWVEGSIDDLGLESDGYRLQGGPVGAVGAVLEDQFADIRFLPNEFVDTLGVGVFLKYQDANNWIKAKMEDRLELYKRVAGTTTLIDNDATALPEGNVYWLRAKIDGDDVEAGIYSTDPIQGSSPVSSVSGTLSGAAATALGVGKTGGPGFYMGLATTGMKMQGVRIGEAGYSIPDYTVRITLPLEPTSPIAGELEKLLRVITPANLDLEIFYDTGFVLGFSALGEEAL